MTGRDQPPLQDPPTIESTRLGGFPRWAVYAGRGLLWALLAGLVVLGVVGILRGSSGDGTTVDPAADWPSRSANVLALQEADRWLSSGAGTGAPVEVDSLAVAAEDVADDGDRATVTVAVRLAGGSGRWLHVGVPLYRQDGRVGLAGTPGLLAVPATAEAMEPTFGDRTVPDAVTEAVEGWAGAYAEGGSDLSRWMTTSVVTGLAGNVALDEVTSVEVLDETEDGRTTVLAGVRWMVLSDSAPGQDVDTSGVDGPRVVQTYRLDMVEDADRWYVQQVAVGYPSTTEATTTEE